MTQTIREPYWRVWVWDAAALQWMVHSSYPTRQDADDHAEALTHRNPRLRTRVQPYTRRRVVASPPPAPTAAQRFREAQSDRVVVLRQALAYYKSGSNGTEIASLPSPDATPPASPPDHPRTG